MTILNKQMAQGVGRGELYNYLLEQQNYNFTNQGEVYFVDGNSGSNTNDGSCWDKAFKTLTYAMGISHVNIAAGAKGWASRNTIFCKGDALTENLTANAQKTDIVGVGSCDAQPMARITGTHAFTSLGGCRFFNFEFWNDSADANFTFTTCDGIEFHNCKFSAYGTGATPSTYALRWVGATGSDVVIENCIFRPMNTGSRYSTIAVSLEQTTLNGLVIRNNIIEGVIALNIDSINVRQAYVTDNLLIATTFCVDDESDLVMYANCQFISDVDNTTNNNTIIDWNVKLAVNCIVTGSNHTDRMPTVVA